MSSTSSWNVGYLILHVVVAENSHQQDRDYLHEKDGVDLRVPHGWVALQTTTGDRWTRFAYRI